jgi:hypothetical protein
MTDTDERILATLQEIARWTRFMGLNQVRNAAEGILKSDEDRAVYYFSNGASVRDVERLTGVGRTKVARRWDEWQAVGLMHDSTRFQGRKEATFSLAELGIALPELVRKSTAVNPAPESAGEPAVAGRTEPPRSIEEFAAEQRPGGDASPRSSEPGA